METEQLHQFVEKKFGKEAKKHLLNKRRGGNNNAKGELFEEVFIVAKIAHYAAAYLDDQIEISIQTQVEGFVDDLEITKSLNIVHAYQLKNAKRVSWKSGKRPIAADFEQQKIIYDAHEIKSSLFLVVTQQEQQRRLIETIPSHIESFSKVDYFPCSSSLNRILLEHKGTRNSVSRLCIYPDDSDKQEAVLNELRGAWAQFRDANNTVNIEEILKYAYKCNPNYIRYKHKDTNLKSKHREFLDSLGGFNYTIQNAKLAYQIIRGKGKFWGEVPFEINSREFEQWLDNLMAVDPADTKSLLTTLIGVE